MIYYLLGLALLLVVISWIYYNYPFDMTQGDHTYEGDYDPHSGHDARLWRYLEHFTYKAIWNGQPSSCWCICCYVYETITSLLGNAIPSARSILASIAAVATLQDTRQSNAYENQLGANAHQLPKQEVYSEEEEGLDEDVEEPRGGRRKNKRKKKQKKRRKHGRRRRHVQNNVAHEKEDARIFQKTAPRDVEQENDKLPSPVEELLRLDREATMTTVLKFDQMVWNALGKMKSNN
ncbi:uncharacterized protein LOC116303717 [Actinia tenebrosa]|uniref:Uncharacterized protein LOC116303717 n=1 Tax=Actinia tenebrosa TaxID=6105 RepID=A0A6P8IQF6_ACTTE|nr:uncharacterized protein LOC116303717 [Actinia tenebrosa]